MWEIGRFSDNCSRQMTINHYIVMQYDAHTTLAQGGRTQFSERQRCKNFNAVVHSTGPSCAEIVRSACSVSHSVVIAKVHAT